MKDYASHPSAAAAFACLLIVTCLGLLASPARAVSPYDRWAEELGIDPDLSYDGTRVMEYNGHQFEISERRAPGKMYTEMYVGNMMTGVILREDLGKSYILMPSMGFYREESLENGLTQASNGLEFSQIEPVGKEEVNGYTCTKYKARFTDEQGKGAGFIWVTEAGVPMKMDMIYSGEEAKNQRITMQFTELNLREQDPAYFELPADLKPMGFGGSMSAIGAMMGLGDQSPAAATAQTPAQQELAAAQKRCLEEAANAAREQNEEEDEGAFGFVMGAVSQLGSVAESFGLSGSDATDVYAPGATEEDIATAAQSLGVTPADIERCRAP